ncbi:G-protein coupled receptor Mth2-like isoform X2 [Choristoneura fumiferana]|uniref:G-protein coupled receptor Mth2-like isoform X2 n=1 Tax=Choristoneura fumiferana TaxID=7141 RepID=UPI003D155802
MAATQRLYFVIFLITLKTYCTDASVVSNITIKTTEDYYSKCNGTICIMKCCPDDLYVGFIKVDDEEQKVCLRNNNKSIYSSLNFDEAVIYNEKLTDSGKRLRNVFYLVESELLEFNFSVAYDLSSLLNYYLLEDGSLEQEQPNSYERWTHINSSKMCIDYVLPKSGMYENHTVKYFVILETPEMYETDIGFVASALLISCVFLVIVLIVYALLPELRNLCGLILMSYVASLFGGFLMLATLQLVTIAEENTDGVCFGLTITIYYFFLASFCWMNVMSFDIWWTFSGKRGLSLERWSMRARFCAYAAYAFGFPTGLTVLLAALEFSGLPAHPLMPMLRDQGCFLYGRSKLIYLYGPIVILCIANMVFFILTAWKINQIKKQTQKTLKSKDSCSTDQQRTDKQRFLLYLKLFTVMGINWILEVVSALYPQANNVWRFVDAYNVMIGFFIFVIFVCKKKIIRLMKKRYHQLCGHPMSRTQTTSTRTLSSTRDDYRMESVKNKTQV